MTRRSLPLVLVAALGVIAAACTGGGATTTAPDEPASTATSSVAPEASTTTAARPAGPPWSLTPGLEAGTSAAYDIETTYRQSTTADLEPEDLTIQLTGRRRVAAFDDGGGLVWEVLADPGEIVVTGTQGDEQRDIDGRGRSGLDDATLDSRVLDLPVTIRLDAAGNPAGGVTPIPGGATDPLGIAVALDALVAPPPPPGLVDVGDGWDVAATLPWLGGAALEVAGTAEVAGTETLAGGPVVDVDVDLQLTAPELRFADLAAELARLDPTSRRIAGIDRAVDALLAADIAAGAAAGTVAVASGSITGRYRVDPARGVPVESDVEARLVIDLALVDDDGPFGGSYVVEARTTAALTEVESGAPRLAVDADAAASGSLPPEVAGYVYDELDPGNIEQLLNRLGLLLDDPLLGLAGAHLIAEDDGPPVDVLTFYPAGFSRGDPSLLETVAAVVTGEFEAPVGEPVEVGGLPGLTFEDDETGTWVVAITNTRLLVAVGEGDVPAEVLAGVVAWNSGEYRWEAGDCHDFDEGERFDPPFSPFGTETLVPCYRPHSAEVITAVTVDEGPDAAFPDDLDARSELLCGQAFLDHVGTPAADSRLTSISYLPDEAEWEEGDRYLACIVAAVDDTGAVAASPGSLAGRGEEFVVIREPGTCFDGSLAALPTDCAGPHVAETIGSIAFDEAADAPYPGDDEFLTRATTMCQELLEEYADQLTRGGAELEADVVGGGRFEWERGERTFDCVATARNANGDAARVTGGFDGPWQPLGSADDAFSA